MTWWQEMLTSSHPERVSYFNLPLRNLLPTPTKSVHLTNLRKRKAAGLTSAVYTDEACGKYRKRNAINTQKKKYVSGRRISISIFELYLQDDGVEAGAETSKKVPFRGLCIRQYICQNSPQFGHRIECTKCSLVAWGVRWRNMLWKIHLWEVK